MEFNPKIKRTETSVPEILAGYRMPQKNLSSSHWKFLQGIRKKIFTPTPKLKQY